MRKVKKKLFLLQRNEQKGKKIKHSKKIPIDDFKSDYKSKRKKIFFFGCVLTWHQWFCRRISNIDGITDLAKDHPVASALRLARNLTYNECIYATIN